MSDLNPTRRTDEPPARISLSALENDMLRAEIERLLQAVGLATTAVPDMQIDVKDPVGMMRRVVAENERLRAALRDIASGDHHFRSPEQRAQEALEGGQ